jgi:sialic acid synthase SpsE
MAIIKIGEKSIGADYSPFTIAEAGINHNGELEKAYRMVYVAKEAGADAIKFQTFKAAEFITDPTLTYTYTSQGNTITESMLEMFRRYEFTQQEWRLIKNKCDEVGIVFLSTPQNSSDLELLLEIGISAVKVGSDDFTNLFLLKQYAKTGLPIIVSCGMSNLAEVYQALETIGTLDGYPTILMLCTSQYPTPPADVNLLKLKTLRNAFPMAILGFSDHTRGDLASCLAVALGASIFEKHFTLSHDLPGPDHWFSEEPAGIGQWIASIHTAHQMLGSPVVRPTQEEEKMKKIARRSVVTLAAIKRGELFSPANIGLRRPGYGIQPCFFEEILASKATRDIACGTLLKQGDFE